MCVWWGEGGACVWWGSAAVCKRVGWWLVDGAPVSWRSRLLLHRRPSRASSSSLSPIFPPPHPSWLMMTYLSALPIWLVVISDAVCEDEWIIVYQCREAMSPCPPSPVPTIRRRPIAHARARAPSSVCFAVTVL